MRRGGAGAALLATLLFLAVLGVGADYGFRLVMEERVARSAQESLDLPTEPDVDLRAFPFIVAFLREHIDEVGIAMEDVRVEGMRLDRVDLDFRDVSFEREAFVGSGGTITAAAGRGEVTVTDDALSELLQDQGVPLDVEFTGPGIDVRQPTLDLSVAGRVRVEGSALVFSPQTVPELGFEVNLPEVVPGMAYERITVEEGRATAEASLAGAHVEVRA
jgi:LmeA-like phospholipid-binding